MSCASSLDLSSTIFTEKQRKKCRNIIINLVVQVNFLVRITSVPVVDVTTFGSVRALSDWSLRIGNSSNASRRFSRNVTCFPEFPRCKINHEIRETNIFMASVFVTKRSARDGINHWKVTCFP